MFQNKLFVNSALPLLLLGVASAQSADIDFVQDLMFGMGETDNEVSIVSPTSIAVTSDGSIYVADLRQFCVFKFSTQGQYLDTFGHAGEGPGDIMFGVQIDVDPNDRLTIAGMTGRIDFMDSQWNFIDTVERHHPGAICRGVSFLPSGGMVLSVADAVDQTSIDRYGPELSYETSFGATFAEGHDLDWRFESLHAGGYIDVGPDGAIYHLQLAPYELRVYDAEENLIRSTSVPGSDFVPFPPKPEFKGDEMIARYPWQTNGLAVLSNGYIVTSAYRKGQTGSVISQVYVHDPELSFVGLKSYEGLRTVLGRDGSDRVFFGLETFDEVGVVRCRLVASASP